MISPCKSFDILQLWSIAGPDTEVKTRANLRKENLFFGNWQTNWNSLTLWRLYVQRCIVRNVVGQIPEEIFGIFSDLVGDWIVMRKLTWIVVQERKLTSALPQLILCLSRRGQGESAVYKGEGWVGYIGIVNTSFLLCHQTILSNSFQSDFGSTIPR